jgi:hypothetical protein
VWTPRHVVEPQPVNFNSVLSLPKTAVTHGTFGKRQYTKFNQPISKEMIFDAEQVE